MGRLVKFHAKAQSGVCRKVGCKKKSHGGLSLDTANGKELVDLCALHYNEATDAIDLHNQTGQKLFACIISGKDPVEKPTPVA